MWHIFVLASDCGLEQDTPHSCNNFQEHLSLRFWNWPEAALEVVDFKPVYLLSLQSSWERHYWRTNSACLLALSAGGRGGKAQKHVTIKGRWWQGDLEVSTQPRQTGNSQTCSARAGRPWSCFCVSCVWSWVCMRIYLLNLFLCVWCFESGEANSCPVTQASMSIALAPEAPTHGGKSVFLEMGLGVAAEALLSPLPSARAVRED